VSAFVASQIIFAATIAGQPSGIPPDDTLSNSLGMEFVRVEPDEFLMGSDDEPLPEGLGNVAYLPHGDFDEHPRHRVRITQPFFMAVCEVTNAQYEQFDPQHRKLRGKMGFSKDDDEAVVFVSWHDAVRFCEWLSKSEGLPYRLPTEAEWEYACRAGTNTLFNTGDSLPEIYHKVQGECWYPDPDPRDPGVLSTSHVGQTPPNAWGLHDMHGNVEEWCYDWYGPYEPGEQADPLGRADGKFKVTRGGSHSTFIYYLRSANRSSALPDDRTWLIGFRLVLAPLPISKPLPPAPPTLCMQGVKQGVPPDVTKGPNPAQPYFKGPRVYVKIPPDANGPLFARHNHVPSIVECPNGDLLAVWYTCVREPGREVALAASRLRFGDDEWEPASLFWDAADRTEGANALWFDGDKTIYNFIGFSVAATWGNLAVAMQTSTDSGATWSRDRIILPEHGLRQIPIPSVIRTRDGQIILPCDADTGEGGTALFLSPDNGDTWCDPGGTAAGIHAGVVELNDGRLMTLGRGNNIDGMMPMSLSDDMGKTWVYRASPFPPIGGGQRLALVRLQEGPLFFASFAKEMPLPDGAGGERQVSGLFAAVSCDDGETWPLVRVLNDPPDRGLETSDGRPFMMTAASAEPAGYLTAIQARNGVVHLISSRQHYALNLAWLVRTPTPQKQD
jgi:formylglycine-generating enzyme required for sulfatase activity